MKQIVILVYLLCLTLPIGVGTQVRHWPMPGPDAAQLGEVRTNETEVLVRDLLINTYQTNQQTEKERKEAEKRAKQQVKEEERLRKEEEKRAKQQATKCLFTPLRTNP